MEVRVHETPVDLAEATAGLLAETLAHLGNATLGLAGGGTPRKTYELLPSQTIDWERVTMWLGDERWVPPDHEDSNERMARTTFVDEVTGRLVSLDHSTADPATAAARYGAELDAIWVERDGKRAPDVVLLGIGDDGHTASLFPGSSALDITDSGYVAVWVGDKSTWRLSATMPLLWSARHLVFLVSGEQKAAIVAGIIDGREPYPARRVAAGAANVTWMLDEPAAQMLHPSTVRGRSTS